MDEGIVALTLFASARIVRRLVAYAWASPNTLLGLFAGFVVVALGGRLRIVGGVAEFSGGLLSTSLASFPGLLRFNAITFGHVILGVSEADLVAVRSHEHVHVRQYEAWGPFFLFAYVTSSLWQLLRGRRMYRDNFFERQAYAADASSQTNA